MDRIEKSIIESFTTINKQSFSELIINTTISKETIKKYLLILIDKGILEVIEEESGRSYQYITQSHLNRILVLKSAELVGSLGYELGCYYFKYDKEYKGKRLDGLHEDGLLTSATLFPVFENLIPENDRRDIYLKEATDVVEILLELKNTHGDFDFISAGKLYTDTHDYTKRKNWLLVKREILEQQKFVNILNLKINLDKEILKEKGKYSSLAGYQNKIDVNIDFKKLEILHNSDALYVLKPYSLESAIYNFKDKNQTHLPFMGLNEHLFMSFAKNAYGFDVPWSGIIIGENDFHYVVKRYDRYNGYKYEQRDFAQIMNIKSKQKYCTSSENLFDAIKEVIESKEERIKFFEFYFFSFIIEHADLHVKNISTLSLENNNNILSPLYDLISNGVYRGDSDELGLPLNGKKRKLALDDFYLLSDRLGISKSHMRKIAHNMITIFIKEFPRYIETCSHITAFNNLQVQKNRYSFGLFSENLQKFYDRRIQQFRQRGILDELGI